MQITYLLFGTIQKVVQKIVLTMQIVKEKIHIVRTLQHLNAFGTKNSNS